MKPRRIILALLCCLGAAPKSPGAAGTPPPATLVLAERGRSQFSIVLSAKPSPTEEFAARELQRYVSLMSGARLEITSRPARRCIRLCARDAAAPGPAWPADIARLPPEGYRLLARDDGLWVVGADGRGALYAVYDLLERLGCRWLAPAFSFYQGAHELVPARATLVLALPLDVTARPGLKYRKLYVEEGRSHNATNLLQMIDWMPKRRFNTLVVPLNYGGAGRVMWDQWRDELTPELRRRGIAIEVGGHGYQNYLNAEMEDGQLFARHPDWFGMDGSGQRTRARTAVFCTSNKKAAGYVTANVIRYLEAHPEIDIFDFWPPDGAHWCQCPDCQALGAPADRQALLLAGVSAAARKIRPGIKCECIAYGACLEPPARTALDTNVLVDFCPIGQSFEFQMGDPQSERNAAYAAALANWRKSFQGDISIYSYYRKYAWQSLPVLLPHYLQNDLRFYGQAGARGISSYAEPGDWAAYEVNHYVLGGLAWNPEADVDEMMRDFAGARFGPQAALGRKVYQALEDNVRRFASLPGTALKTPAQYRRVLDAFQALAGEIEAARGGAPDRVAAALNRLALSLEYARRDLSLQQARAEKTDPARRRAMIGELLRFLREHAAEGVFLGGGDSAARLNRRYGAGGE